MNGLKVWNRRWAFELGRAHRIPMQCPRLVAGLCLVWLPVVVALWYSGTDLYRSDAWVTLTLGGSGSTLPGGVSQVLPAPRRPADPQARWERLSIWWHLTAARITAEEGTPAPEKTAYPDWTSLTVGDNRFAATLSETDQVHSVEVTESAWYVAAWSADNRTARRLARHYAERLAEQLNRVEELPRIPPPGAGKQTIAMRSELRKARLREQRAQERLQRCFGIDEFGVPDVLPSSVTSSVLASLENEAGIVRDILQERSERLGPQHPQVQRQRVTLQTIERRKRDEVLRQIQILEEKYVNSRSEREGIEGRLASLDGDVPPGGTRPVSVARWTLPDEPRAPWLPDCALGFPGTTWLLSSCLVLAWISAVVLRRMRRVVRIPDDLRLHNGNVAQLQLHAPTTPESIRADVDSMTSRPAASGKNAIRWGDVLFEVRPQEEGDGLLEGKFPSGGGQLLLHGVQAGQAGAAGALAVAQLLGSPSKSILIIDHRDDDALSSLLGENNPWLRYKAVSLGDAGAGGSEVRPSPTDIHGVWYTTAENAPRKLHTARPLTPSATLANTVGRRHSRWDIILRVYGDGHRFEADRLADGVGCVLLANAGRTTRRQWLDSVSRLERIGHPNPRAVLVNSD